jgi:hypothetical protein
MPTNINFVEKLDAGCDTQVSFNLPKTLSLGTVKKSFDNNGLSEAEGCSYLALNTLNQVGLLGKASLIVNPSSFSENTLYADLPANSTLGDLTFTRATDAWRVNSQGLVQRTPWNILRFSEQFDNAAWDKTRAGAGVNSVVTANAGIAPNGTNTADRVQFNCVGNTSADRSILKQQITPVVGTNYTASFYIKAFSVGEVGKQLRVVVEGASIPSTIITLTADWTKVIITGSVASVITGNYIFETRGTATANTTADILLWGAQLVEGSSALEYFPTTDRQDVPRIDYSLGGCPTLLVEPQRTNIALQSEQISTSPWTNNGGTTTLDAITAPTGLTTADKFIEDASTGQHYIGQQITGLASTTYTMSVFAKKAERDIIYIRCFNSAFGVTYCDVNFNLTTGVATGASTKIEAYPNGWYRCSVTFTTGADPIIQVRLNMTVNGNYNGIVGYGMYMWGAQLEAGSYLTSYIPTTTASVTRNADSFVRNNIYSNGLITAAGGTWFVEFRNNIVYTGGITQAQLLGLGNDTIGATANNIFLACSSGTRIRVWKQIAGTLTTLYVTSTDTSKVAIKWNGTTADIFENGVKVVSATAFTPTALETLRTIATQHPYYINEMALFPTPLTDMECLLITS